MMKRELGLVDVFSIAAGAMVSSGLFVLPGLAFELAGPSIILAYVIAGLLMIPSLLAQSELATAMPKTGGTYFFVERSLGPLAGTFAGFANWLSIALKSAFALIGIGTFGMMLVPGREELVIKLIAAGACVFFGILNILSVKGSGRFQSILVFALLGIMGVYLVSGAPAIDATRFQPFAPHGVHSIFTVAGMVFVSYGGLTKVASVAEEVRNPGRNVPLGMFIAFIAINLLYVFTVSATVGILPAEEISGALGSVALAAKRVMGPFAIVVTVAALLAFVTTANAGTLSAARSPVAMSRDGLFLEVFGRTNKRFGTPHFAIAFTALFMIVCILFLSIEDLVKMASSIMLVMFILVNLSLIIMRQSGLQNYRPVFRTPFYPWMPIGGVLAYCFLLVEMGKTPLLLTGAFMLATGLWYLVYVRKRIDRESALVFLIKRMASSQLGDRGLEDELKSIALVRDEVELDRFDQLVEKCEVLDIKDEISLRELFSRAAEALAPRVGIGKEELEKKLLERERSSSTVLEPGLAVPHVVVEGEHVFEILLARCQEGAVFSEVHPPVKAAFFLVGSPDERNYHLRALMSIAHVVREPSFRRAWEKAAGPHGLRDALLLSSRERHAGQ